MFWPWGDETVELLARGVRHGSGQYARLKCVTVGSFDESVSRCFHETSRLLCGSRASERWVRLGSNSRGGLGLLSAVSHESCSSSTIGSALAGLNKRRHMSFNLRDLPIDADKSRHVISELALAWLLSSSLPSPCSGGRKMVLRSLSEMPSSEARPTYRTRADFKWLGMKYR